MESPQKTGGSNQKEKTQISYFLEELEEETTENKQSKETNEIFYALPHTIIADTTSNQQFFKWQVKSTLILVLVVLFLKALPSPLITNTIQNDPQAFTKQLCSGQDECSNVEQGYESIIIKKVNSFQRQLKYFAKLNYQKYESLSKYFKNKKIDINEEVTWIEIYAYRNGETYGSALYQKSGEDIYEILFDNQALIFIGEIHVLEEQSYLIKIYKMIRTTKSNPQRKLEIEPEKNESSSPSNTNQPSQASNNSTNAQQSSDNEIKISIPLTVQLVRYSQFYTAVELIIRYVTLLIILYVRGQTTNSPAIFHYILILTANPLIFIEIAFPTTITNIVSTICSSMYIAYLAVFLYYCHRRLRDHRADMIFRVVKMFFLAGLWIASIMRQLHLVNQTKVQLFQYILMGLVLIPLLHHLWKLYFIRSKTILHRNILFISLTIYFLLLLFFSGYLVNYGWKKISSYLIVQIYGCELCYLTSPFIKADDKQTSIKSEGQMLHYIGSPPVQDKIVEQKDKEEKLQKAGSMQYEKQTSQSQINYIKVQ